MAFYVNPASVLAVGILFIILSISAVGARFAIRYKKTGFGIDDYLCLPAMVSIFDVDDYELELIVVDSRHW
ncbi:hypothetical protein EV356DRAFT_510581 [Viridothelium virens]|uniref:Uncharacterized protein n=1 Tax=Viridothelium virens TaxID=1048519 RepID=A0A6A6HJH9_VIRVR|nr:hypothetical protein EV356DRAFT_510581 [Viridothelium virens]